MNIKKKRRARFDWWLRSNEGGARIDQWASRSWNMGLEEEEGALYLHIVD